MSPLWAWRAQTRPSNIGLTTAASFGPVHVPPRTTSTTKRAPGARCAAGPVDTPRLSSFHRPDVENGSLYVLDSAGELHLLRPFIIAQDCPRCRTLSTFHVDRVSGAVATLKSFEHGHLSESPELLPALTAVGLFSK